MTTYRPPRVQTTSYNKIWGTGKIRASKDGKKMKVILADNRTFVTTKWPEYLTPAHSGKEFKFSLSEDGDEIFSATPLIGMFVGKVVGFVSKKDEPPVPVTKYGQYTTDGGKVVKYSYQQFLVRIEFLEPKEYAGFTTVHVLRYNFAPYTANDTPLVGYFSKGKHTEHLIEFLDVCGAWKFGAIEWSDNILPELEARILRANQPFQFSIKNGWINDVYPTVIDTDDKETDVDENANELEDNDDKFEDTSSSDVGGITGDLESSSNSVYLPWDDKEEFM